MSLQTSKGRGWVARTFGVSLILAALTLTVREACAQMPSASPTVSPSPTSSPIDTPEPEFCVRDAIQAVDASIDLIDVVEMIEPGRSDDRSLLRAKRGPQPAGGSQKQRPLEVTLARQCCTNGCTTGTLTMPGFTCKTLELPNLGNKKDVSCIPPGRYVCVRVDSPKFGDTFTITEVEGRSEVRFHSGNTKKHTTGCVLLGMSVNDDHNFISGSKDAMKKFLDRLSGMQSFVLTIKEDFPRKPPPPPPTFAQR